MELIGHHNLAALIPGKNPGVYRIKGCVGLRCDQAVFEKKKSFASAGIRTPGPSST
jgi:hypothetical protein